MAPCGHAASHARHSMQSFGRTTVTFLPFISSTFAGQTSTQFPAPWHFFRSTFGGKVVPPSFFQMGDLNNYVSKNFDIFNARSATSVADLPSNLIIASLPLVPRSKITSGTLLAFFIACCVPHTIVFAPRGSQPLLNSETRSPSLLHARRASSENLMLRPARIFGS